jgi:RNA polymerase sigma-70 factor (ECF subfamily)
MHDQGELLAEVNARRGALLRLAYRFCWNAEDAEDAVQDALLLAAERRDQLHEPGKLWPWVCSIVVRQCHDLLRRAGRRRRVESPAVAEDAAQQAGGSAQELSARREFAAVVRDCIAELPERQRAALVLKDLEGMSYEQIAEVMGIAESTARVTVRNAREAVREAALRRSPDAFA